MDIIYSRIRDLVASSGNSALLSLSEKPTVASTLAAEKIQASKNDYLTRQFQNFLNNVINEAFDLRCEWNVTLHGNIFTCEDEESQTKELVKNGVKGLIPKLLSYEEMTVEDYIGSEKYLDALGIDIKTNTEALAEENMTQEAKQLKEQIDTEEEEETKSVGRPAQKDSEVTNDNTDTSRSQGGNVSEVK